jgi:glycosyltransferase involved in cell wall biosynthesis
MVVGLRGVVGVQGGIETHARMLYPRLARLGCEIEIVQRAPYYPRRNRPRSWHGTSLKYIWSPTHPGLETAVHTFLAVLYAALKRPDILHLHAVGPGLLAPLARALGLRVVFTHHAADYEREKWGRVAKLLLRAGESFGARFATRPIAVSPVIQRDLKQRLGVRAVVIPNGAPRVHRARTSSTVAKLGLSRRHYILCVARLEPTKRQIDLVDAFERAGISDWKLALVGAVDAGDPYCERLRSRVESDHNVVLAGYQSGRALQELYTHAALFVLPSSLEGHPIALLEAASYGLPILASAIPANLTVPLPREWYFPVGNTRALAKLLRSAAASPRPKDDCQSVSRAVRATYSWKRAALLTKSVYDDAARHPRHVANAAEAHDRG